MIANILDRLDALEQKLSHIDRSVLVQPNLARSRVQEIQREIAKAYDITLRELLGDCREESLIRPRHLAIYLSYHVKGTNYSMLGRLFNRDHGSISFAVKHFQNRIDTEKESAREAQGWMDLFGLANKGLP